MSLQGIISRFFNTTVTVQRRITAVTSTGSFSETWNDIASDVPATIQALSSAEGTKIHNELAQGKEYTVSEKAYMPLDVVTIKNGDRILDSETNLTYEVEEVQTYKSARVSVNIGHHYKLLLKIPKAAKS